MIKTDPVFKQLCLKKHKTMNNIQNNTLGYYSTENIHCIDNMPKPLSQHLMQRPLACEAVLATNNVIQSAAHSPSDNSCLRDALREFQAHKDVVASSGNST